jgi:hypothetical protein
MGWRPRWAAAVLCAVALGATVVPGIPSPVAAAEYTLESSASYDIRTNAREVGVRVALDFTNTTPDPAGQFSVFGEIQLAVQDGATRFVARDGDGRLTVTDGTRRVAGATVHVATIELRAPLRYQDSVSVELRYALPDGASARVRVRPSVAIFPAWSFGTSGEVSVEIPQGYEMRVDGDPLTEDGDVLVSGPIDDPAAWVAHVTAVAPPAFADHEATVPLEGGTADLVVRAFPDDRRWGRTTLDTVSAALPLIEDRLGLPYPLRGQLILVESVPATLAGFGESAADGTEIPVSFDQPPFTALHQVAHVWLPPTLVDARWIEEGLASQVAAAVGEDLDVEPPFDPDAEAEAHAEAAFPLDAWSTTPDPEADAYGYAASWAVLDEISDAVGAEAIPAVLARVAASVGPYERGELAPEPAANGGNDPAIPLTSRSFLDQLEAVTDGDLAPLFADRVLTEADVALLDPRAEAREAFDALVAASDGWGAPDSVASAMAGWRFDDATAEMAAAAGWLEERDALLEEMAAAGLSAPDRLRQAYRAYGGRAEAAGELEAEREVVDAYLAAAERVNAERSFLERLGLVGGPDPEAQLEMANGHFTDGDLRESRAAIAEAERIVEVAPTAGIVRIVSLLLVVGIAAVLAIVLFRRRAYTAGR